MVAQSRTSRPPRVAQPRRFTYEAVDNARSATENDDVYNLERSHRGSPRRIGSKTLHKWHGAYARVEL